MKPSPLPSSPSSPKTVSFIGGKEEVTLTRSTIQLLVDNKILSPKSVVVLYLMMEYGVDHVSQGLEVFEKPGELNRFALAYGLEPVDVLKQLTSIKSIYLPLENAQIQLQLLLSFANE